MASTGSENVHKVLVTEAEHSWTLGLMAYAIVEDQKYEWIAHIRNSEDRDPTNEEVESWFRHRTPGSFARAISDAEHALQLVVDDAWTEAGEAERREVLESTVIAAVKEKTGNWRQFCVGVAAGLVSALIFAVLIVIVAVVVLDNRSLVDVLEGHSNPQIEPHSTN